MGRNSTYTLGQRVKACEDYLNGKGTYGSIGNELGTCKNTVRKWVYRYKSHGLNAFVASNINKSYTQEFKIQVVKEYLAGYGSNVAIASKYNISSSMVNKWISRYNNGEELKDYVPKRSEVYTMKSRKTTFEERLEIVKYAINHDNDYRETADKYYVGYSLVYQWVKKYNELGEDGLKFLSKGRPSKKEQKELTELEKKDKEIEKLKLELERHKRAEEILKKNMEIRQKLLKDSHK